MATAKPTDKLVLMLLASYAQVWPDGAVAVSASQPRLLAESGMSANTWRRALTRLEALGAVRRSARRAKETGIRLTTGYALTPERVASVVYPEKTWAPMAPESPPTQNGQVDDLRPVENRSGPPTQNGPNPPTQNRPNPPTQNGYPLDVLLQTSVKTSEEEQERKEKASGKSAQALFPPAQEKNPPPQTEREKTEERNEEQLAPPKQTGEGGS